MIQLLVGLVVFAEWLLIPVPFVDQNSEEWWAPFDCGPASAQMVIQYYTDELYHPLAFYNDMDRDLNRRQGMYDLSVWMGMMGVPSTFVTGSSMEDLQAAVEAGIPVVVLFQYEPEYGHIVVVIGMDTEFVYVNDPAVGPNVAMPILDFQTVWFYARSGLHNVAVYPDEAPGGAGVAGGGGEEVKERGERVKPLATVAWE